MEVRYDVRVVEDDALPDGCDWAACNADGHLFLFVKRSRCEQGCGGCPVLPMLRKTRPPGPPEMVRAS